MPAGYYGEVAFSRKYNRPDTAFVRGTATVTLSGAFVLGVTVTVTPLASGPEDAAPTATSCQEARSTLHCA